MKTNSTNNIWNKEDYKMCGLGSKNKFFAKIKHFRKCLIWSKQRIIRGYSDSDKWHMYDYLQTLIPDMLQDLRNNRHGSPGYLGENYTNEKGIVVNDSCHAEWDRILDHMIFLWKESNEDTCSRKNSYEDEYYKARKEFDDKYGRFGEKLQTEKERKLKRGEQTVHFMSEVLEYKAISDKYFEELHRIGEYRCRCKDEALDLLKEHFYALWD